MTKHGTTRQRDGIPEEHTLPGSQSDGLVPWLACYHRQLVERGDDDSSVETAVPAAIPSVLQATCLPLQRRRAFGFTLAELLVSVGVLVLLVLLATQLLDSAAIIATLGHKQMDTDSQGRELLDRMSIDVRQMVKRLDVDYLLKASTTESDCTSCSAQAGDGTGANDQIAFYSNVPGYYPSGTSGPQQSSVSIVGYRIKTDPNTLGNRMERLGEGLVWNGATSDTRLDGRPASVVFWAALNPWANATNSALDLVGRQVFRFEYYYLLRGATDATRGLNYPSILSDTPWDTRLLHASVSAMRDVAAVVVDVAVVDPRSRVVLNNSSQVLPPNDNITRLAGSLSDFAAGMTPGELRARWRATIDGNDLGLPRSAISGIRVYERYLYLSPASVGVP